MVGKALPLHFIREPRSLRNACWLINPITRSGTLCPCKSDGKFRKESREFVLLSFFFLALKATNHAKLQKCQYVYYVYRFCRQTIDRVFFFLFAPQGRVLRMALCTSAVKRNEHNKLRKRNCTNTRGATHMLTHTYTQI